MKNMSVLTEKVREQGLRLTRQRKVVYEELARVDTHPRAEEAFQMVKRRLPQVSLGTVYRNLKTLKEMGLISEYKYARNYSRFDARIEAHHHFTCLKCDWIFDLLEPPDLNFEQILPKNSGFKVDYSRLEFYGECPSCSRTRAF